MTLFVGLGLLMVLGLYAMRPTFSGAPYFRIVERAPGTRVTVTPVDSWKPILPGGWVLGQVSGVTVDTHDRLWVLHRPSTVANDLNTAPPLLHLKADGELIAAYGEPGLLENWPQSEHGLFVDHAGDLWVTGNGPDDNAIFKLAGNKQSATRFGGSASPSHATGDALGGPADVWVDSQTGIAYVADGYRHRRVAAFAADTSELVGEWPAHGMTLGLPVHCVIGTSDRQLFVCDRANNRIQMFNIADDGALTWRSDIPIAPETEGNGSVWDVAFSPDERLIYVADGENERVWIVDRATEIVIGHFGTEGHGPGQFSWLHHLDTDSQGNLYTVEVGDGRRVQKFNITVEQE